MKHSKTRTIIWLNGLALLLMVTVNALAVVLPINGITPGEVSDAYPNLFAPAAVTFSIWSLIYLLLLLFTLYQLVYFKSKTEDDSAVARIGPLFIISSVFNILWIFCWHYQILPLSFVCIAGLLISLAIVNRRINAGPLSVWESICVRLPFSVYFGWLTIATIANFVTLLVSQGWEGTGSSAIPVTMIMLLISLIIGLFVAFKNRDAAYSLVLAWASLGIFLKHRDAAGFDSAYPVIMWMACAMAVIFLAAGIVILVKKNRK